MFLNPSNYITPTGVFFCGLRFFTPHTPGKYTIGVFFFCPVHVVNIPIVQRVKPRSSKKSPECDVLMELLFCKYYSYPKPMYICGCVFVCSSCLGIHVLVLVLRYFLINEVHLPAC